MEPNNKNKIKVLAELSIRRTTTTSFDLIRHYYHRHTDKHSHLTSASSSVLLPLPVVISLASLAPLRVTQFLFPLLGGGGHGGDGDGSVDADLRTIIKPSRNVPLVALHLPRSWRLPHSIGVITAGDLARPPEEHTHTLRALFRCN